MKFRLAMAQIGSGSNTLNGLMKINRKPNNSMDVRARTATFLSTVFFNPKLRVGGFATASGVNPT